MGKNKAKVGVRDRISNSRPHDSMTYDDLENLCNLQYTSVLSSDSQIAVTPTKTTYIWFTGTWRSICDADAC